MKNVATSWERNLPKKSIAINYLQVYVKNLASKPCRNRSTASRYNLQNIQTKWLTDKLRSGV